MGIIFSFIGDILKKILIFIGKILLFLGAPFLLIPIAFWFMYERMTGDLYNLSYGFSNPLVNVFINFLWLIAIALCVMRTIENVITMKRKEKFRFLPILLNRKEQKGFEAKLGGETVALKTANDLSGVVFGKQGGKYATMPETTDGHILIVGGAGSQKTSAHAIPTLMSWKSRVFAIDIKGELYAKTKKARGEAQIKVFNPTDPTAYGYDPFYMLKNAKDISSAARQLALSIIPLPADVKDPFWVKGAQNMLTGFIIYFQGLGESFSSTMKYIKSIPTKELIEQIVADTNEKAKMEIMQFSGMDDKTLSGVYAELSNHITIFATSDDLQRALSGKGACITPADLESGYDIYCCVPQDMLKEWKELLTMMCNQFLKSFESRGENNKTPILFLIDEFADLGKIEAITSGLATLRSKNIHIDLIVQSKSQLNAIYGKDVAEIITDNCAYKAILRASEPTTQEWCSKLVGTYDKKKVSSNYNADIMGVGKGQGTSSSTEEKRIIKPEEFGVLQDVVCIFPNGYKRLEKASCYDMNSPFFEKLPADVQEETRKRAKLKKQYK